MQIVVIGGLYLLHILIEYKNLRKS